MPRQIDPSDLGIRILVDCERPLVEYIFLLYLAFRVNDIKHCSCSRTWGHTINDLDESPEATGTGTVCRCRAECHSPSNPDEQIRGPYQLAEQSNNAPKKCYKCSNHDLQL
jgi:hypothetical protein